MPVGQSGESQQWITASMRLLSLAARGGFLERALSDMRKVAPDRGPVRLGTHQKDDGTRVPMWHDSEVAAMAYAVQNILARRVTDPVQQVLPLEEPASQVVACRPPWRAKYTSGARRHPQDGCVHGTATWGLRVTTRPVIQVRVASGNTRAGAGNMGRRWRVVT